MVQLILGTASFAPKGYAGFPQVALTEIDFILNHAVKGGIHILEGAESYNCDEILNNKNFELIYKVRHPYSLPRVLERTGRQRLMGLLYHHGLVTKSVEVHHSPLVDYHGTSIYNDQQMHGDEDMIEVPLNLEDRRFEKLEAECKIVRSIFGRGELLKKYSVKECLDFVRNNPTVHGVIVGVNSVKELDEILKEWNR